MVFRRKVELDIEEVRPDLDIVRSASKELRGSERFRNVLKVIERLLIESRVHMNSF